MSVHRLELDRAFARFHLVFNAKESNWIQKLGGKSVAKRYKPLSATLFEMTRGKPGDLFLLVGTPIVTAKAWSALEKTLGPHVEALPITAGKEKRFILNVLARNDAALDEDACKDNRIAVHKDALPDAPIFGIARAAHVETLVDDTVALAVKKAKLKGWAFDSVINGGKARRG